MGAKLSMIRQLHNEKGITLVELLAVIIIISLLIGLISSTQLFGARQYNNQMKKTNQLYDITYALKVITKDIRKSNTFEAPNTSEIILDGVVYKLDQSKQAILKDGNVLVNNVETFNVQPSENYGSTWKIEIINLVDKKVETEIVIRKGD